MDYNSTSFAAEINSIFKSLKNDPVLKRHQLYVLEYIKGATGILVQHDLGTGKSMVAASILAQQVERAQVVFLSAKTLHANMIKAIAEYEEFTKKPVKKNYAFVTMNASNMLTQMKRAVSTNTTLDDKFRTTSNLNLDNKVLIVDEAHNFFNSITNGSENAMGLYRAVMSAKNLKTVFMTGTPIVNHPFELVPCFNMIARREVLPSTWEDFNRFFVDIEGKKVRNRAKFQNRIVGLISYYGAYYNDKKTAYNPDFPRADPPNIVRIPMSDYQMSVYSVARDHEKNEASFGVGESKNMQKPKGLFTTSYKRLSRQFSNIVLPENALSIGKKIILHPDKMRDDDLKLRLEKFSPKFAAIYKEIINDKNPGKHLLYSSFVENAGINLFSRLLLLHGWEEVIINDGITSYDSHEGAADNTIDDWDLFIGGKENSKISKKPPKRFVKIAGDVPPENRGDILKVFNADNNANGEQISLMMISGAGAEGLDLKAIRMVHIMEPYWNWMRLKQVIGRAVRYKSHIQLPSNMRNVKTNIYISDYPSNIDKANELFKSESTTDNTLYKTSQTLNVLIQEFYRAMAEAAVDCASHNNNASLHCRLCSPTGEPLYVDDIFKDMNLRSPCVPMKKDQVKAKEITIDGEKFAYYKEDDNFILLKWSEELNGYIELARNDPRYAVVYNKIIK